MAKHLRLTTCLAAIACLLGAAATPADASIDLKFDEVDPNSGITAPLAFNGGSVTARVGQLHWQAANDTGAPPIPMVDSPADSDTDADNVIAFCIELGQHVSTNWKTYDKTSVSDAPDPSISGNPNTGYKIGANRAAALDVLADNYWSLAIGNDLINAVAFQLAVWELVHEDPTGDDDPVPSSLNVSQNEGTFFVDGLPTTGSDLDQAISQANTWLAGLGSLSSNDSLSLIALTNPYKQDQLVQFVSGGGQGIPEVPEPTALLVWGCLGGCVGLAVSRRRRA